MTDFDINSDPKTWTTRDGRKVVIYCTDAPGEYQIHGRIVDEDDEPPVSWTAAGRLLDGCSARLDRDLISPRKTIKVDFWVNVYPDNCPCTHLTKESADKESYSKRIACKHIVLEVTEGEFDQ